MWPWPAYPHGHQDFEAWVAVRYPFWLDFHQTNSSTLAKLARAEPS